MFPSFLYASVNKNGNLPNYTYSTPDKLSLQTVPGSWRQPLATPVARNCRDRNSSTPETSLADSPVSSKTGARERAGLDSPWGAVVLFSDGDQRPLSLTYL